MSLLEINTIVCLFGFIYSIDDPNQGAWTDIVIPSAVDLNILDSVEIEDSDGDFRLYVTDDSGMIYEMFNQDTLNWTAADGTTTALKTKFRTPYLRIGELGAETLGATGRVDPRYLEIRVKDNTAVTFTATIESADGPSQATAKDSQTVSMEFGTNNSAIRQAIKPNFQRGEFRRLTIENDAKATDYEITGVRLYYKVQPFEGQKIAVATV